MPRNYHSSAAECPYYRGESSVMVFCAAPGDAETLRLFYRDGKTARIQKAKFCRRDWKSCQIAKMLGKEDGEK